MAKHHDDLDAFTGRARAQQDRIDAWLYYLVDRMPAKERRKIAAAMKRGALPLDYDATRPIEGSGVKISFPGGGALLPDVAWSIRADGNGGEHG